MQFYNLNNLQSLKRTILHIHFSCISTFTEILNYTQIIYNYVQDNLQAHCLHKFTLATWSEVHTVLDCLNNGLMWSNLAQGMEACPRTSVSHCNE